MIRVTVFDGEQYDPGWPTSSFKTPLVDVIAWFQGCLAEVPEQYRETAYCEIDSVSGFEGGHLAQIEIAYSRPETDEELASRIVEEGRRAADLRSKEIAKLRELQEKYGEIAE